jgi:hypothetical protein
VKTCIGSSGASGESWAIERDCDYEGLQKSFVATGFIVCLLLICGGWGDSGSAGAVGRRRASDAHILGGSGVEPRLAGILQDV